MKIEFKLIAYDRELERIVKIVSADYLRNDFRKLHDDVIEFSKQNRNCQINLEVASIKE